MSAQGQLERDAQTGDESLEPDGFTWRYVIFGSLLASAAAFVVRQAGGSLFVLTVWAVIAGPVLPYLALLLLYLPGALLFALFTRRFRRVLSVAAGIFAVAVVAGGVYAYAANRFAIARPFYEWRVPASANGGPRFAAWTWSRCEGMKDTLLETLVYDESGMIALPEAARSPEWLARAKRANARLAYPWRLGYPEVPGWAAQGRHVSGHFYMVTEGSGC